MSFPPGGQPVLTGSIVQLEPLEREHVAGLREAAEEDRSEYQWSTVPDGEGVEGYVEMLLGRRDEGMQWPFVQVRRRDGRLVGCTSFWDPRPWPAGHGISAVEIGWTWLAGSAQRTGVNVEAKLLLMSHAFVELGVARVDLKTDARNERSRTAIAALGARFEGILRNWSPSHAAGETGRLRDSAMFSVTDAEWPDVERHLRDRLARHGAGQVPGGRSVDQGAASSS